MRHVGGMLFFQTHMNAQAKYFVPDKFASLSPLTPANEPAEAANARGICGRGINITDNTAKKVLNPEIKKVIIISVIL
jgi:hypothetical protein